MAGFWRIPSCIVAILILSASKANAGFDLWYSPPITAYYAPMPICGYSWVVPYYYCPPATRGVKIIPLDTPSAPLANPIPAPPSPEPPLNRKSMSPAKGQTNLDAKPPIVVTTHSAGSGVTPIPSERCRVGFWNLAGRDVTLTVDAKTWTLPKDREISLELDRQFGWHIDQRSQQFERVADGASTHEVVIRD